MEQVRERAQQMAKDILAQALAQAEQIRASAQTEGFAAGQHDAISIAQAENEKVRIFLNTLQTALLDEKKTHLRRTQANSFQCPSPRL